MSPCPSFFPNPRPLPNSSGRPLKVNTLTFSLFPSNTFVSSEKLLLMGAERFRLSSGDPDWLHVQAHLLPTRSIAQITKRYARLTRARQPAPKTISFHPAFLAEPAPAPSLLNFNNSRFDIEELVSNQHVPSPENVQLPLPPQASPPVLPSASSDFLSGLLGSEASRDGFLDSLLDNRSNPPILSDLPPSSSSPLGNPLRSSSASQLAPSSAALQSIGGFFSGLLSSVSQPGSASILGSGLSQLPLSQLASGVSHGPPLGVPPSPASQAIAPPSGLLEADNIFEDGGRVVTFTREEDRAILLHAQQRGPHSWDSLLPSLDADKTEAEVQQRYQRLVQLAADARRGV
jgi:hypothetical protein